MPSSRGSSSNFFYEDEEEKMQVNGKVIKFRHKSCTDCCKQAIIKAFEFAANPTRLYYKCERLGCYYFK